jgi:Fe2+ or Zn2+ uptake regulation protein
MIEEKIRSYCRAHGIVFYKKRMKLAEALNKLKCATADELWLFQYSHGEKISIASVYNILHWLTSVGFAEKKQNEGKPGAMAKYCIKRKRPGRRSAEILLA